MSSGTRNRAASKIQSAARRSRIIQSLTGQLEEFLANLSQSPNVILLEVLSVNPDNPPNTITLMVDTQTSGGATKRTLLCIDVGGDRKIRDINADCIKDPMPRQGLAFTQGYGSIFSEIGPSRAGIPTLLGYHTNVRDINGDMTPDPVRLRSIQNQLVNFNAKQRGFNYDAGDGLGMSRVRYPLVTQLGLSPQELLDVIEGGNYCIYPVFKKICKRLRQKIKDQQTFKLSPTELEAIQELIFSDSDNVINILDASPVTKSSLNTRSYGSDDIRNLMNGELLNGPALDWLGMSPRNSPPMSPNRLFSSDESPPPPPSPPPSPPRLRRHPRRSPPDLSPPARRARRR